MKNKVPEGYEEQPASDPTVIVFAPDPVPDPIMQELEMLRALVASGQTLNAVDTTKPASTLSPEVLALIQAMQENTIAAIAEMRKPTPEEQQKLDEAAKRRAASAKAAADAAYQQESSSKAMQSVCAHSKPDGFTSFVGQVNSDGMYRPFCPQCRFVSKPIRATEQQKSEGLQMSKWKGITIATLNRLAQESAPATPRTAIPLGMVAEGL